MAYLDHAATTPMRDEVVATMEPYYRTIFANPSGAHAPARQARRAIDESRDELAGLLNCAPRDIVFTSGGTEADNMAVFGVSWRQRGRPILCSAIEHHAVLDPVLHEGGQVIGVDSRGLVDLDDLRDRLSDEVALVSVMTVNNEIGSIQPLADVARIVRDRSPGAALHTDAVQGFGWVDVATAAAGFDLLSLSAHKFGGPKGVGLLMVRNGVTLEPLFRGGGQEAERRSGTQNVAGIVGLACAARISVAERDSRVDRIARLRDRLLDGLIDRIPTLRETAVVDGDRAHKIAGSAHVCIPGIEAESLLFLLEKEGLAASSAASCASGAIQHSHVLDAIGIGRDVSGGSLRLSLGDASTDADVDDALRVIPAAIDRLTAFVGSR